MNISIATYRKIAHVWQMLRIAYGLLFLAMGVDKFFNLLVKWETYINPLIASIIPPDLSAFLMLLGIIEIVIGLLIFSKAIRLGSYAAFFYLALVIINLLSMNMQYLALAAQDIIIDIGALALARLTTIKQEILSENY